MALFQDYAEKALAQGSPPKGLEQAFAATLQISPSMWSQIKSSRPIGDKLARQIPLKRVGEPDDIANGVLYLASDESKFMTGAELKLDGGISAM